MSNHDKLVRQLLLTHRNELRSLLDINSMQGSAAGEEIQQAMEHMETAIAQLERGMDREE